ncbi:MAG TPA: hypothetical protein ENG21_02365 [Nitrososphaeria archaeon]|nr:MAG: hypothetical protein DRN47_05945 [Candidatus Wolframiiraptor sp.]HDD40076.1 hypothetical protein [Nitrososphaeria archaeon]
MEKKLAASFSIISGVLTILNSWSFFQQSSFHFTVACYLLAFGSLDILAAAFLLICERRRIYWGALIIASSILAFLSFALSRTTHLLMPALIAFYLGVIGGMLSLASGT